MNTKDMLQFLSDLKENNSLVWMKQNKKDYINAKEVFLCLVSEILVRSGEFDASIPNLNAEDLIFRLNKDTRFSKDKSPYNPAFRAHISSGGKGPIPVGYFISVSPHNRSFLGGGLFTPMFKDATSMVRDYISEHGAEFDAIISPPGFQARFAVKGEALKNVPAGYDNNHAQAAYLKNKSWYLEYPLPDSMVLNANAFVNEAVEIFALMQPFNCFLNSALNGFKMPERNR